MSTETLNLSLIEKRALLAQLLKQKADQPERRSPLSYGQRAWWFLYQLEPQNPAYNIMMPVRILSEVDVAALRRAFEGLVARHASLRTRYTLHEGQPVQEVVETAAVDFAAEDASAWDEEKLRAVVSEEMHRPFDLERGSVLRARLYTLSEREHVLSMAVHHIAFDLWSLMLFMHELGALYAAEKHALPTSLSPLSHRYADYVRWQSKLLSGGEGERLLDYWREQLSGELLVLNLPTYRPRPGVQTQRGAAFRFTLSRALADRLKALSRANGVTLYVTMLAAYKVLLHRYSGQSDIVVGSLAAAGRNRAEFSGLVGFFDNQIALRSDLSRNPTFEQFLAQVQQTVLGAFEHQNYPFPLLVEKLQPERDASRSPIFQTMFILQRAQLPEEVGLIGFGLGMTKARVSLGELTLEPVDFDRRVAAGLAGQLDLTLIAADLEGQLECSLQYNPDIFDAATVEQMSGQFERLLESIVAEPGRSVGTLPILRDEERSRAVVEWNDTAVEREFECLHGLFERQAGLTPDAEAAVFGGQRLTYGELNRRANKLAHHLRSLGVGPEVRVGICFERSMEMLVAVFGILKAGGAYVPLDPNYPQERLAFMLEDTHAHVLLTQQHITCALPSSCGATVVRLDADWAEIERQDDANPAPRATIENLAYIIYTSGSTGRPKGVMIDHRSAANTILDMNERYSVGHGDRVLALSSLSFDLSVYDMLGTLAAGATVVIPNPSATPDPSDWLALVEHEGVTIWNSAPALMEVFVEHISGHSASIPRSLRLVLLSGDWIPVKLPDHLRALATNEHVEVHSLGGATEASIWSIAFPIQSVDPMWKSIPYGLPMVNQQFHVLDPFLEPAPVGVVGELYIGGSGVALGYHNRQELTAEKFIPDPFAHKPGARLYRTGDLGRRLPGGHIEFLGRIDGQVKIRGFRIELGEIETALGHHSSVREAVVMTQAVASGEKRLVAYVVPQQQEVDEPQTDDATSTEIWKSLVELSGEQAGHTTVKLDPSVFPALIETLNRLTFAYLSNTLRKLGAFTRPGDEYTLDELMGRCACVARYRKAVRRWLELLASQGLLRRRGAAYVSETPLEDVAIEALWKRVEGQVADTQMRKSFNYFKSCGDNLADVVTGKLHPAQLLFHEGDAAVAESFYEEGFRYCNAIAREATKGLVRAWPRNRALRVLEVGAGIGSTTSWLLPELPPQTTTYAYTDISKYFMEMCKKNFGDYPFVNYSMLDIERNPQSQGYEPHSFDLIVASSVLHATRDLKTTLRNVRSLLAPRGLLLLVEETVFYNWFNVLGIQEGFDRFEDEALRHEHPFLTTAEWDRELRAHGFDAVASFSRDGFTSEFLGLEVIVARASTAAAARIDKDTLRRHLRDNLPEFMVPSAFVVLDVLPLTPNGKVDRRALTAPGSAAPDEAERAFVEPRNPTEEMLAGLWSQVLHAERISVEDNFFELGGDSLLATQMVSRLRVAFDVEMPLHCLFETPTVAGLAAQIDLSRAEGGARSCPPVRRIPRDRPLSLSYAQQRLWFLDRLVPGNPFYNVTAAVRFRGTLDSMVLERSLNEIVSRHESLRTTFIESGDQAVQVVGDPWPVNVRLVDFTGLEPGTRETELQRLATDETQRPFNLIDGPLLRVVLVRLDETEHVLLLTLHHIIFDGWSFGVLLREIASLYEAFLADRPSPLVELPVQYADFAAWQREWLASGVLDQQLAYWRKQLAGSMVLQLPSDRPRPETQTFCGARHLRVIPAELSRAVKELSSRHDATFYMTVLAAFKTLLHRYTGSEDVLIGSPIANRTRAEVDDLIGFFLNAMPLRTDLSGDPTFIEMLGRVRETALGAYANQDVPFEKLVEELQPERQVTHTPFFRTWLVLQNAPMPPLDLPGLSLSMLQVDDGTSKFDLVLSMFESDEGLHATWIYNTDLFDAATVARMAGHFETLLRNVVARPDAHLSALEIFTEDEIKRRSIEKSKREESNLKKLKSLRRTGVNLKQMSLTKTEYLDEGETLPLIIRPTSDGDLAEWAHGSRNYVETELQRHGALLFRGFNVNSPERFEELALALCPHLFTEYGDLPREDAGSRVYHSTPYPEDSMILYHNESSHVHQWPLKIMFYCAIAPQRGGETPIVDGRKVYRNLDPALRRRFEEKRLMYVRNYKEGLDVQWQSFFGTQNRSVVESYCRRTGMEFQWTSDGGLRTRKVAPAVVRHPRSGEVAFFNQIQAHHISCLDAGVRRSLRSLYAEEDLPRNVYYGDGTPIDSAVIDEVREVYRQAAVVFPWQEGDVLLVDNVLTSHARNAFVGPRKILVAMGDMVSHEGYEARPAPLGLSPASVG